MTKLGDILLTIAFTLILGYFNLFGLIFQTLNDDPSYNNDTFDKMTPIISVAGLGLIVYSLFVLTKIKYILLRLAGVALILPLIITDTLKSYPTIETEDKIINAIINLPNLLIIIFITLSLFRRNDFKA